MRLSLLALLLAALAAASPPATAQFVPDDPLYDTGGPVPSDPGQWNLRRINAPMAWDITTGSDDIVLAVIDNPANLTVQELDDTLWPFPSGQPAPVGPFFHGTPVSSIALGETDNAYQIAGIAGGRAGSPGVRLMFLGWSSMSQTVDQDLADALQFARENGADLVNMSFVTEGTTAFNFQLTQAGLAELPMFAAAGNGSQVPDPEDPPPPPEELDEPANTGGCPSAGAYPARSPYVMAVGATLENDERWFASCAFSTSGARAMAPGGKDIPAVYGDGTVGAFAGTSAAAPHAAGVAALLLSVQPALTRDQLYDALAVTADPTGCIPVDPDIDDTQECGSGRIDAYAALVHVLETYGGTLAQDVTLRAGQTWELGAVTLAFEPGHRLIVEGTLHADGTTFTATDPAQGWGGIRFEPSSSGDLTDAVIEQVSAGPVGYAVLAYNAELSLDGTRIRKGATSSNRDGGIYATGSSTDVVVMGGSLLRDHADGYGLVASAGADVLVAGDDVDITGNAGGVSASGVGSTVTISGGRIEGNLGRGASAYSGGTVEMLRGYTPGGGIPAGTQEIRMLTNNGGLIGETGGLLTTDGQDNNFRDNGDLGGDYDAYAFEFTTVDAERAWWGHTSRSLVHTAAVEYSTLDIDPILTGPPGGLSAKQSGSSPSGGSAADGSDPADPVHDAVVAAERLRAAGDAAAATSALASALATATTERERGLYAAAATRLVAGDGDAALRGLAALSGLDARSAADLAPSVAVAFPDAEVSAALRDGVAAKATSSGAGLSRARPAEAVRVTAHPNPATRVVTLAASAGARIDVFDTLGREVARFDGGSATLDVTDLAPGLYVARAVRTDGGRVVGTSVVRFTVAR